MKLTVTAKLGKNTALATNALVSTAVSCMTSSLTANGVTCTVTKIRALPGM